MHSSRAVLRKPRSLVIFTFSKKNYRPISTQVTNNSNSPLANLGGGGGGWNDRYQYSGNDKSNCYYSWFLRSVCMGLVIGASSDSYIAYADNSQHFADAVDKKPKFSLFGGNMHPYIHKTFN